MNSQRYLALCICGWTRSPFLYLLLFPLPGSPSAGIDRKSKTQPPSLRRHDSQLEPGPSRSRLSPPSSAFDRAISHGRLTLIDPIVLG